MSEYKEPKVAYEKPQKFKVTVEFTIRTTDTAEILRDILQDVILTEFLRPDGGEEITSLEIEKLDL